MENVRNIPPLNIQGAKIVKRNFAGRMEDYGATTGNRYNQIPRHHQQRPYFCCVIVFSAFFG